jgi:hypothetical protein
LSSPIILISCVVPVAGDLADKAGAEPEREPA